MTEAAPEIAWPAIAAVALLTGIAFAIHLWLRSRGVLPGNGNPIKLVATKSLGAKRGIAIVEVENERFLLGLSEDSVSLLTQLNPVQRAKAMLQPLSLSSEAVANAK